MFLLLRAPLSSLVLELLPPVKVRKLSTIILLEIAACKGRLSVSVVSVGGKLAML